MSNSVKESKRLFTQQSDGSGIVVGGSGNRRNRRSRKKYPPSPLAIMLANFLGASLPSMKKIQK